MKCQHCGGKIEIDERARDAVRYATTKTIRENLPPSRIAVGFQVGRTLSSCKLCPSGIQAAKNPQSAKTAGLLLHAGVAVNGSFGSIAAVSPLKSDVRFSGDGKRWFPSRRLR